MSVKKWYKTYCNIHYGTNYEINEDGELRIRRINRAGNEVIKPSKMQNRTKVNIVDDLENEEWELFFKRKRYEYYISNVGRVKNRRYIMGTPVYTEKLYSMRKDKYGYMRVFIQHSKKSSLVHRLVAEYFLDSWDKDLTVNHKNLIKTDNRVENLEMMTHIDNIHHAYVKRRENGFIDHEQREANLRKYKAKIRHAKKQKKINEIIAYRKSGMKLDDIGKIYGISKSRICDIIRYNCPELIRVKKKVVMSKINKGIYKKILNK